MIETDLYLVQKASVKTDVFPHGPVVMLLVDGGAEYAGDTQSRVQYTMTIEEAKGFILKLQAGIEETKRD